MNVCYLGPLLDYSGYGEANRHAVAALDAAGIHVISELVSYTNEASDFGELGKLAGKTLERQGDYKIKILHTTPDQYKRYHESGKYHIGHFFWETSRVPIDFVEGLNFVEEIWTGSEANKKAMLNSGVTKPIYIFPQAIESGREFGGRYKHLDFDGYMFYSIFEWIDRKNPEALLNAYWSEFQDSENVGLMIKTYFRDFTSNNKRMIRHQVREFKMRSGLKDFPRLFLYTDLMDRQDIGRFHATGDCFVSAHRGEGWGVPQVEAMLAGRPIISTNYGGVHEYLINGKNALLVPYEMTQLRGMRHSQNWYTRDQRWAEVDRDSLRSAMRTVFDNPKEARDIGAAGQTFVKTNFDLNIVGKLMADRLMELGG